ncbi:MAG: acetyltransferase [Oscillospiraceae bacterium]|jgi:UDP-perosamine 4-acetyltransferase|nr:acetyltransferase [Oscillospiraceae bacterium]
MHLLILGSGGHAKSVWEAAKDQFEQISFLTNDPAMTGEVSFCGCPVAVDPQTDPAAVPDFDLAVVAVGDNRRRLELSRALRRRGIPLAVVLHPRASVSGAAELGPGTVVLANASVNAFARLGTACIVNTGAVAEHDCLLGDGTHLAPNAAIGGAVRTGEGVWFGIGSCAAPGIFVGDWSVVGAGAAVLADVPERVLAAGVPAKIKKHYGEI